MMESYDPLTPPDPAAWLAMGEGERFALAEEYVRESEPGIAGEMGHIAFHVTVENQIALDDETPVKATVDRLMREGLDRHEAIHAIGSVLAGMIWEQQANPPGKISNAEYFDGVKRLTAESWLATAEDSDDEPDAAGGLDEPGDRRPLSEVELLYSLEGHIAAEDKRARENLGLTLTDSNVKSALRKAMVLSKGRSPKQPRPEKLKPKERWIAGLARDFHGIGKTAAAAGVSAGEFQRVLRKIENSIKVRTDPYGGSRSYLDFLKRFIEKGEVK